MLVSLGLRPKVLVVGIPSQFGGQLLVAVIGSEVRQSRNQIPSQQKANKSPFFGGGRLRVLRQNFSV